MAYFPDAPVADAPRSRRCGGGLVRRVAGNIATAAEAAMADRIAIRATVMS